MTKLLKNNNFEKQLKQENSMKKIIMIMLLMVSMTFADTFVKRFAYSMICKYNPYTQRYLQNCGESVSSNSIFIFNYDNSSDILWKTDDTEHRLFNVGRSAATTNDDGDSVYVYNFIADSGENIQVAWQGTWVRLIFDEIMLIDFSNVYSSGTSSEEEM